MRKLTCLILILFAYATSLNGQPCSSIFHDIGNHNKTIMKTVCEAQEGVAIKPISESRRTRSSVVLACAESDQGLPVVTDDLGDTTLTSSGTGACLVALDIVLVECAAQFPSPIDDTQNGWHRTKQTVSSLSLSHQVPFGSLHEYLPDRIHTVVACVHSGSVNFWSSPSIRQKCCEASEPPPSETSDPGCENSGEQVGGNDECAEGTPILISLAGNRMTLTGVHDGVHFDLNADGVAERLSWTRAGSDDAFLVLDRNGNGRIDDGTELFGSSTTQPDSSYPNGFRALSILDLPTLGGNGDGVISEADPAFQEMQLWLDQNHDGVSQASELQWLSESGIRSIALDHRVSPRIDRFGNRFRYISRIDATPSTKWAVDVIFVVER